MTLSVYDPVKGRFVLNPKEFVINAFHPDYVKTYMPEFMSDLRIHSAQHAQGVINGGKSKAAKEAKNKAAFTTNTKSKKVDLAVKDYYTFSKAGMPKGTK
jgi:hypothetical protein